MNVEQLANVLHAQPFRPFTIHMGDGRTFLVKHRAGDATHDVAPKTANAAIKKPDATGKSTNELEVRVQGDKID